MHNYLFVQTLFTGQTAGGRLSIIELNAHHATLYPGGGLKTNWGGPFGVQPTLRLSLASYNSHLEYS